MRILLERRRRTMFYVSLLLALGLFGFGLLNDAPSAISANSTCGGQELAGQWLNKAKPDGSDVLSAKIQIPCTSSAAAAVPASAGLTPKIELQLTVRCMHLLSCDWQAVPASWTSPAKRGDTPTLSARYDQDRFDRTVTIEPIDNGKLRLTLTSRFKGIAVAPVKSVYTLERQKV